MSDAHLRSQPTYMTLRRAAEVRKATRFSPNAHAQSRTLPSPLTGRARAVRLRLRMRLPAGLVTLGLLVLLASTTSCRQPLTLSPRHVSPDTLLIFEQRVASSALESGPDWESWRLYESGRLVYSRAGAAPTRRQLGKARLATVHAWLRAHDFELLRNTPRAPNPAVPGVSAMCQLRLSTGLVLAPFGDRRYYACDELKKLSVSE
jgi:hypothetical protein